MRYKKVELTEDLMPSNEDLPVSKSWSYEVLKKFRLIFKEVQQHSQWVETNCGVSSAQLWAMWELSKRPGLRVTELAKAMCIHQSTASNLLEKLARKGLVKRERPSEDRRTVSLFLTEAGFEVLGKSPLPAQGILQHALFNLPEETLHSLSDNLDSLIEKMGVTDNYATMQPISSLLKLRKTK